ncbi:MAG: hypothetical protein JSV03_10410, partial [Planctomycetota bacterium]
RPDVEFPEFAPLWREGWSWTDESGMKVRYGYKGMPLGAYVFAYFKNTGENGIQVQDVLFNGISLAKGIAPECEVKVKGDEKYPSSLKFSKLPKDQIDKLIEAGEPVWWKVEPMTVSPGSIAEVTIRLRRNPKVDTLQVGLPINEGKWLQADIRTSRRQPRFFSINFSPALDKVFAYLRHHSGTGVAPEKVFVDGKDVTERCTIVSDSSVDTVPVVIELDKPLSEGSYHFFQADYDDGSTALAGIGAWQLGMVYGMWGCNTRGESPEDIARRFLTDMAEHNINVHMSHCGGPGNSYMNSEEGLKLLQSLGMRQMLTWVNPKRDPVFYFLTDEPDAADFMSRMLEPSRRLGSLGQWLVERCKLFRRHDQANAPILLNVDNTFKPENWYMYAQLADIPCADPYYQEAVQSVWSADPTNIGAYVKPTYVYAVGTIYQSAAAPDPMHLILHTCRFDFKPEEFPYRGPTPEEKRVEVYYALAAGTKAISYWWYSPNNRYHGCGGDNPEMVALWTEIGLMGAELRTAAPLITLGCPADIPLKAPRLLWVRSLLAGADSIVVLVVNDNMASDRLGTVVKPQQNAFVKINIPSWIEPGSVFEINYDGTKDINWKVADSGVHLELGTVDLTRLIVISQDSGLRKRIQRDYDLQFASNVRKLTAKMKK